VKGSRTLVFLLTMSLYASEETETDWNRIAEEERSRIAVVGPPVPEETESAPGATAGLPREDFHEKTRERMLQGVDRSWDPPSLRSGERLRSEVKEDDTMRKRLEKIVIPRLEFSQLALREVISSLNLLSEEYDPAGKGINIVLIDPEKRNPDVSILLRHLDLNRILDLVLQSVGFSHDLVEDAVLVRWNPGPGNRLETEFFSITRSTIIRLAGLEEKEVDPAIADPYSPLPEKRKRFGGSRTEQALKDFLERAGVPFDGIEGANLALADGQLIVTQTPRALDKVKKILQRYSEIRQVEIEARFIEVQDKSLEEVGFEWTALLDGKPLFGPDGRPLIAPDGSQLKSGYDRISNAPTRNLSNAFQVGNGDSRIIIDRPGFEMPDLRQGAPRIPTTIDLASEAGNLVEFSGVLGSAEIDLVLRALERQTGSDLLSSPKVTVLSGKTAEITIAQEFRYPESYGDIEADVGRGDSNSGSAGVAITAGTPRDFEVRNIGVEMSVTPAVEDDNAISLLLEPTVTEFEGFVEYGGTSIAIASDTTVTVPSGFYQPIFSVRRIRTEVTIWDGATVVMGGLTREQAVEVTDKVPLLGDIPFLGRLFRTEGESSQKRNLLIFVTANLISPGGSPARQTVGGITPGSLFQQSVLTTPGGEVERKNEEKKEERRNEP